ncbi:MAG: AsmA family protein [Nitrospirae bacterium]|nr:AsmA family protein [Nitrospirota bacterium]
MKKILTIIIVVTAVIIISFVVLIKTYVTPEKVKAFLVPYAEQALNRKISIGEVNISLFRGIDIKDFAIKETDGKSDFVKCKDFILKFQLLPILSRKVIVDELKLLSPEIRIIRDNKGSFNFEGIGEKEKQQAGKEEKQDAAAKGLPISLLVKNISIKDAGFSFVDSTKALPDTRGSFAIDSNIKSTDGTQLSSTGNIDLKLSEIIFGTPSRKPIRDLNAALKYAADVNLSPGDIRIDKADLKIQEVPVSLTGDVKNFRKEPEINIAVSMPDTKSADLQKLLTSVVDMNGLVLSGNYSANFNITGMPKKFDSLKSGGEIKISSAKYRDLTMNDFHTKYLLKDSKLEIVKMTAVAGKGKLNVNSTIDLSKPGYAYNLSANIDSLHADEVVNSFSPKAKGTVFGLLSLNLKLNGSGTAPESIKKNLIADGDFNIRDGKITGAQITRGLSQFLNIKELETINLKQANGEVTVRNSVAHLESVFSSDDIAMDPSGNIGLDETLDLAVDLKLSPSLTKKAMGSGVAKYIKDDKGWGDIPLKISGTFSNPSYTVDIAKAGGRVLEKEVGKALDKLLKKQKGAEGDKTPRGQKPVEDLLQEIFK